jgi:hypothetical protein
MKDPGYGEVFILLDACDSLEHRMHHDASLPIRDRLDRAAELGVHLYILTWQVFPDTCRDWLGWRWPRGITAEEAQASVPQPGGRYDRLFHVGMILAVRSELRLLLRWLDDRGAVPGPYSWHGLPHRLLRALEGAFPDYFPLWVRASSVGREPTNWIPDEDTLSSRWDDSL